MVKILVADSSEPVREMLKASLEEEGYEVIVCNSSKIALDKAKAADDLDLFLFDMNMPEIDGISFTKRLRATAKHKFTPVLVLTASSGEFVERYGKSAGCTGWIVKPLDQRKILTAVNDILYDD